MKREMYVTYGYGRNKKYGVVARVAIGFRADYHHVKVIVVEQKYITEERSTENTLLKVHYRNAHQAAHRVKS